MRILKIINVVLLFVPCIQAELDFTIVDVFNRANLIHEESEMQV